MHEIAEAWYERVWTGGTAAHNVVVGFLALRVIRRVIIDEVRAITRPGVIMVGVNPLVEWL